jgi:hypothetical protein
MIDYAEVTLKTPADGERLREMTANGWREVSKVVIRGVTTYYLERVPIVGPHEDKEHSARMGGGYR